jgi:nitrate reductase gamma subunit
MYSWNNLIFGIYPYLCLTVFVVGSWIRFDREQYGWTSASSQLLSTANMRLASNLFHIGVIGIFFGHLVGLLAPYAIWGTIGLSSLGKQSIAMYGGGFLGVLAMIGGVMLLSRRLTNPRIRATSRTSDIFILVWVLVTLFFGLATTFTTFHHAAEGSADTMMSLAQWAKSIMLFDPKPELVGKVETVFQIHLAFGLTLFLLFPFTRLVHIWSFPIGYLTRSYQIVRTKRNLPVAR